MNENPVGENKRTHGVVGATVNGELDHSVLHDGRSALDQGREGSDSGAYDRRRRTVAVGNDDLGDSFR